jgi:hypothetical protein
MHLYIIDKLTFLFFIVICTPIPTQRLKYAHATIEKVSKEVFAMWSASCPLLGNSSADTFLQKHTVEQEDAIYSQRTCELLRDGVFRGIRLETI